MLEKYDRFQSGHSDLIHDIAHDYHGQRMATCSSDQKLKIFDFNEETEKWMLNDSWKAHDASILKIDWAHPEYGQVIASCSMDRSVRIWEEHESEIKGSGKRWIEKTRLVDSRGSVQTIQFGPHHQGLKLATSSSDGRIRIYEAVDSMNLVHWTLMQEIPILKIPGFLKETPYNYFSLSWCPSRFQVPMIAVSMGPDNGARIFRQNEVSKFIQCESLFGHGDLVRDINWAPNFGRSYELIATACNDGFVRLFKLNENSDQSSNNSIDTRRPDTPSPIKNYSVTQIGEFGAHKAEVCKVEWNITGTLLASSGEDGCVRIWKSSFSGEWFCIGIISAEENN